MAYDYESAHETLDEHTNTNLFRRNGVYVESEKLGIYLAGSERTEREDPTVHGGDESGVLPLCCKSIYF